MLGNCMWLSGRMNIEIIERRAAACVNAKRQKQNKTNVTTEKDTMTSASCLEVKHTRHVWLINYGE